MLESPLALLASLWRDASLRLKAALLIGLPVLALGAYGLMTLSSNSLRENDAQLWVDHSVAVRAKLGTILQRLLVTENAARVYVVSRDRGSLPDLGAARADVNAQIDELERLSEDNPGQQAQVGLLRTLAAEKFTAMEAMVNTPPSETTAVTKGLDRSEKAMKPLHDALVDLDQEEARLQEIRTATLQRARRIMVSAATQTLILGFFAGLGATLLFAGSIVRRMDDLQATARAMRAEAPLADENPGKDEIGLVKQELALTSERLNERTRELRERESELRAIIDNTNAIISVKNLESRFLVMNRAMENVFGIPPGMALGKLPEEIFDAEVSRKSRVNDLEVLTSGQPAEFEEQITHDGTLHTYLSMKVPLFDESGAPYAICGISSDITERHRIAEELQQSHDQLEERVAERTGELRAECAQHRQTAETLQKTQEQLLKAQKLEIAGTVACGIAHDFNNVLTAIMGYASLLLEEMAEPDRKQAHAAKIMRTAERAAALSRQLLAFGRVHVAEMRLVNPAEIIRESESMLGRALGDTIAVKTVIDAVDTTVRVDQGQIEQILLNLAVNARDAMPRGGTISIGAIRRHMAGRGSPENINGTADWVELFVTDEGTGISPEARPRIFEPFFTTKGRNRGSGLGLATSTMIAEQHNGWLECESELGKGSTFRLFLPCVDQAPEASSIRAVPMSQGGNETILVVEDEPAVGELVALLLRTLGYNVLSAENGEAAERLIAESKGGIDLVLTDLNMPRMNGRELIARLVRDNPRVRVILTSGSDEQLRDTETRPRDVEFLPKPFTRQSLAAKVRTALDR